MFAALALSANQPNRSYRPDHGIQFQSCRWPLTIRRFGWLNCRSATRPSQIDLEKN